MFANAFALAVALLATPEQAYALLEEVPALVEAGELEAALQKSEAALAADPENFEAMSVAAALAEKLGRLERALELRRTILDFDPNADESRLAIARLQLALGNRDAAQEMNEALLARHPQSEEALELRKAIAVGETLPLAAEPASRVAPLVRLDLITGYDSNPTLLNDTDGAVGQGGEVEEAAILTMDGSVGFNLEGKDRPLTVLARVRNTSTFDGSEAVTGALPSTVGLAAIARKRLDPEMMLIGDLRYQTLFVDNFNDLVQHFVAPSGLLTYELGAHQLRALAGVELRLFDGDLNVSDSVTPRLAVRDTLRFDRGFVIADLGARLNLDVTDNDVSSAELDTDFIGSRELSALLFGQYELLDAFTGFVGTDLRWRAYDARLNRGNEVSPMETVVQVFAGLRYRLDIFELHVEYAYSTSLASEQRSYDRQQLTGGVRVWYY